MVVGTTVSDRKSQALFYPRSKSLPLGSPGRMDRWTEGPARKKPVHNEKLIWKNDSDEGGTLSKNQRAGGVSGSLSQNQVWKPASTFCKVETMAGRSLPQELGWGDSGGGLACTGAAALASRRVLCKGQAPDPGRRPRRPGLRQAGSERAKSGTRCRITRGQKVAPGR